MSFLYAFFFTVILLLWSYVQAKTYQLCGYKIKDFLSAVLELRFGGSKNTLKFTKRMVRFVVTYGVVLYFLNVIIFEFTAAWWLIMIDEIALLICAPVEISLIHFALLPVENGIKKFYMRKAAKKLSTLKCIKIGITGSYGKTSTKNILAEILGKEYKVCQSPQSYNTEMGICKTILERLDDDDIFIAEMGARKVGDIAILTKFVKPDYAILTTIGEQHIETFKSLDAIVKTKGEILEYMPSGGVAVINGDNPSGLKLYDRCKTSKFLTCTQNGFAYAKNITISAEGSEFTLVIDKRELRVKTRLLGRCNIDNIVTAATLASLLGVSDKDICDAISVLEPTPHRLQIIKAPNMTIIDDSYNSNIVGGREALHVLSLMKGSKIVITPGIVEMGEEQSSANFQLGAAIADAADYCIIMNETNKNYLLSGLISHNFSQNCIFFALTREEQKEILKKISQPGAVVLFENDLPDNFN